MDINTTPAPQSVRDRIRGCLIAGAAGDALGYEVEFMSLDSIINRYGISGITRFALDREGKAIISDDTQMTLFTANGMLMGVTRGAMRGVGGFPEDYVRFAYLDWYYTQTGKEKKIPSGPSSHTWIRDLPALNHQRAPGGTCLRACEAILLCREVVNNSKGCGGIMRVSPMACLMAGYASRGVHPYDMPRMMLAGGKIAEETHKHPLGFLPAALLTHVLYHLILLPTDDAKVQIVDVIEDSLRTLDMAYSDVYAYDKTQLAELTHEAIRLAQSDISDREAIRSLGEGWVAEETWAIAIYCAIRHIDSIDDAIIASVNHDGDSDSTGSVCGNIMGAIYGYEHIRQKALFCPDGEKLDDTLELHDILLTISDDLYTSCIIGEWDRLETPEKRQWYDRYCEMIPSGI